MQNKKKSILDDIETITIFKDASKFGDEHWYKSETILIAGTWGNRTSPIAYIHKPKHVSLEDWNIIKDKLEINLLK